MDELYRKLGVNIDVSFYLIYYSLIWVRVIAMTAMIPYLFGKPVPRYVTMGASIMLAIFIFKNVAPAEPTPMAEDRLLLIVLYLKEAFYGMVMGFTSAIVFHAMSSVGQMIDNQRGMSIARSILPQLGQQVSISGIFLFQLAIVLFLAMGGHTLFFDAFFRSFEVLPVLEFPAVGPGMFPLMDMFMTLTGKVIFIAMQIATPVIIAIFLADLILGLANRIAPQINVWMLGFTIKGSLGLLMLFISITMVASQIEYYTMESNRYVDEAVELLHGKVPEGAPQLPAPEEGLQPELGIPEVKTVE